MSESDGLRMLGCDARRGRALAPLPLAVARREAEKVVRLPRPVPYGVRSGDLASAGWGVVFAPDADPSQREALEPLLRERRRAAGDLFKELTLFPDEDAAGFRTRMQSAFGRVEPRNLPWYLLVVGSPESIDFGFEQDLGIVHAVGRLPFDEAEPLAAYAERLTRPPGRDESPRAAVFAPRHAADPPTELSLEHFAKPVAAAIATRVGGRSRPVEMDLAYGAEATRARLSSMVERRPHLLVTAGHGLFYRPGDPYQLARQGALVSAEWPGPIDPARLIGPSESFAADDLPPAALPGGVALLLGCFTAGTPRVDLFDSTDLGEAWATAKTPFVSALAKRLLGEEGEALAVIGHVGRAFEAGFFWRGVPQARVFEDAVRMMMDGHRLGQALDSLGQRYADLAVAFSGPTAGPMDEDDKLDFWVAMHDARAWCLLGDPAVRLRPHDGLTSP